MKKNNKSTYVEYLPEVYRDSEFTGKFLKVFEKLLTGIDDGVLDGQKGIEQLLDGAAGYFDAEAAPVDFLDWLAGRVALELPEEWSQEVKRALIPQIVQLYKKRGTREGLEKFLAIYAGNEVVVDEWYHPFQVGVTSTVGKDNAIGGGPPGFFKVKAVIPAADIQLKARTEKALRAIIDREKPAHTHYRLEIEMPIMQLAVHSTIGKDTVVGQKKEE